MSLRRTWRTWPVGREPAESQEFHRLGREVDDVDARVRCFFGRDPDGNVVNVPSPL